MGPIIWSSQIIIQGNKKNGDTICWCKSGIKRSFNVRGYRGRLKASTHSSSHKRYHNGTYRKKIYIYKFLWCMYTHLFSSCSRKWCFPCMFFFHVKNTCGLRLQPTFPLLKTLLTIRQITKPHSLSAFIFLGVSIIGALVNNVTKVLYEIPNGVRIRWLAYRLYHRNAEPFDKRLLSSYNSYIFPAFQLYEHR